MNFLVDVLDASKAPSLPIISLPTTLLLAALPHWYSIGQAQSKRVQGGWSNENPRAYVARLNAKAAMGKKLSDLEEMILRAQSAQQNGYEWWSIWAVAVVLGYYTKQPTQWMHKATVFHLAMRIIYNVLYVQTKQRKYSYARTAVFQLSLVPAIIMFFRAAYALGP